MTRTTGVLFGVTLIVAWAWVLFVLLVVIRRGWWRRMLADLRRWWTGPNRARSARPIYLAPLVLFFAGLVGGPALPVAAFLTIVIVGGVALFAAVAAWRRA